MMKSYVKANQNMALSSILPEAAATKLSRRGANAAVIIFLRHFTLHTNIFNGAALS